MLGVSTKTGLKLVPRHVWVSAKPYESLATMLGSLPFPLYFPSIPPSQTSSNTYTHLHPVPPYSTSVSQSTQLVSKGFSTPFVFLSRLSAINILEPVLSLIVSIAYFVFTLSCHVFLSLFFFSPLLLNFPPPPSPNARWARLLPSY